MSILLRTRALMDRFYDCGVVSRRHVAVLGFVSVAIVACAGESPGCSPPPMVAAATSGWATSCPAEVSFGDRTYLVSGVEFHKSWIGERFSDGGDEYEGAYRLRGYPLEEVFVLGHPKNARREGYALALTRDFTELDARRLRNPYRKR